MTTSAVRAAVQAGAAMIPPELRDRRSDTFFMALDFNPILAAATLTLPLNIEADADYLIVGATYVGTTAAAPDVVLASSPMLVTLKAKSAGRDLLNAATHIDNLFGRGQTMRDALWAAPKFLPANSTLGVTLQSLSAASHVVRLCFHGFKLFI